MQIITVYAIVNGSEIIMTTKNESRAQKQCEILNKANKTDSYIVVACNGLIIK